MKLLTISFSTFNSFFERIEFNNFKINKLTMFCDKQKCSIRMLHFHCEEKDCDHIFFKYSHRGVIDYNGNEFEFQDDDIEYHAHCKSCDKTDFHIHCKINSNCDKTDFHIHCEKCLVGYAEGEFHVHCKINKCNRTDRHNHCKICSLGFNIARSYHAHCKIDGCDRTDNHKHCSLCEYIGNEYHVHCIACHRTNRHNHCLKCKQVMNTNHKCWK